jgi:hypothetical protein
MKAGFVCAAILVAMLSSRVASSQATLSNNTARWTEGAPNATSEIKEDSKIEGLKTDDIHIFVNLADVKETEYNRIWVQVSNHGKSPLDFDPQTALLLTDKDKTVRAEVPDKAAKAIQKFGEAKSQELSSAHCTMMTATGCQPTNTQMQMSKQVLEFSGKQADWVRQNALQKKTLAPGEEEQGAILFRKDKKPANYTLRVTVGSQTFEFPVSAQNKLPSYN